MYARRESDARSDVDLLCLAKGGDSAALDVLMARHVEALLRYCRTLTPNSHDAEDLCQEAMTRAIDRLHSLESGEAFRTWLFRVARNLAVDWSRRGQRLQPMPDGDGASFPSPESGPHERVETSEEHEMVAQALQTLKQRHRDVLLLREVEGLSYADIARRLNVSQSAVETLLFRARRRLREQYGKAVFVPSTFLVPIRAALLRGAAPLVGGPPAAAKIAVIAAVAGAATLTVANQAAVHQARTGQRVAPVALPRHIAAALPSANGANGSRLTAGEARLAPTFRATLYHTGRQHDSRTQLGLALAVPVPSTPHRGDPSPRPLIRAPTAAHVRAVRQPAATEPRAAKRADQRRLPAPLGAVRGQRAHRFVPVSRPAPTALPVAAALAPVDVPSSGHHPAQHQTWTGRARVTRPPGSAYNTNSGAVPRHVHAPRTAPEPSRVFRHHGVAGGPVASGAPALGRSNHLGAIEPGADRHATNSRRGRVSRETRVGPIQITISPSVRQVPVTPRLTATAAPSSIPPTIDPSANTPAASGHDPAGAMARQSGGVNGQPQVRAAGQSGTPATTNLPGQATPPTPDPGHDRIKKP